MRNLRLVEHTSVGVGGEGVIGVACVDPITSLVYHVTPNGVTAVNDPGFPVIPWSEHDVATREVVRADVVTALGVVCVVTREGDVITLNTDTYEVEVVGSVSAGLDAACWSPDQELLVLVTSQAAVLVMNTDFDPVTEFPLNQEHFGESEFVNVGWGKKETQFHGTEGKMAAKVVKCGAKPVGEWDDLRPRVSWRGDGQLFVVSYVAEGGRNRKLRVVNREGAVQYTSEDVDGLEHCLSWRPSGNLITSSQRLPNKHDIAFFEKNGLRHGEFTLPFKPDEVVVREVMWNQDSTVLLVWLKTIQAPHSHIVQLWTTGNYHWYLKQEFKFEEEVCSAFWDEKYPLKLYLLTAIKLYSFSWVVSTDGSCGHDFSDLALVGVVDGKRLKMTPFRQATVPPPMSAYDVVFPDTIRTVMFAPPRGQKFQSPNSSMNVEDSGFLEVLDPPGSNSNNLCVVHGEDTVTFLTQAHPNENLEDQNCGVLITGSGGNGFTVKVKVHRPFAQHKIEWDCEEGLKGKLLYNWLWAAKNTLLAFCKDDEICNIVVIDLEAIGAESARVAAKAVLPVEEPVVTVAPAPDGSFVVLQLVSGSLLRFDVKERTVQPYEEQGLEVSFPSVCQQVSLCPVDEASELIVLGLTNRNRLYWGNKQLFANCTSYHIHTDHLLLTTTSHNLLVAPLLRKAFDQLVDGNQGESWALGTRKVERGSRLVTAVPEDTRVVLQMPRGNLEVISPRPLAVHMIKHHLDNLKYHQALDMMRKHRVDLNLIYDHNQSEFLKHTEHFVRNVDNAQWLDLFLANLSEVDVTSTMYSFNYSNKTPSDTVSSGNKIDRVCTTVREAMVKVDEEKFLLPILTSHVKMTKSQMDIALRKVQEMKDAKEKFAVSPEDGLRHLMYIADANELFDVALGTYDFDMVMMVAEKSQKDPKEYLPFLNELKTLEESYMKYKINVHLKRFKKALECINGNNEHNEECLKLIMSERLYREALQVFAPNSDLNHLVCEKYACYLSSKQYHNEAAIMFTRAGQMEEAMEAYRQAGNWKMVLVVGAQNKYDKENMNELCYSLVEYLKERRLYADAAWIYEDYLKNEEDAVDCLVRASQWEDALRVAYRYNRPDLVDTNIKPGAVEQYESCVQELQRLSEGITQSTARLEVVRVEKQKQVLDLLEGKGEPQLDSDLYSDTSTVTGASFVTGSRTGTTASGKTFRSTKNKRKLERKKYSTKEGSTFEDLGLIISIHDLVSMADQMAAPVTALATALVSFGYDLKAIDLQNKYTTLLTLIEKEKPKVWPTDTSNSEEPEFGPQLTTEGIVNQLQGGEGRGSFAGQRMRELEPHLRHPPSPARPRNWALHMLKTER